MALQICQLWTSLIKLEENRVVCGFNCVLLLNVIGLDWCTRARFANWFYGFLQILQSALTRTYACMWMQNKEMSYLLTASLYVILNFFKISCILSPFCVSFERLENKVIARYFLFKSLLKTMQWLLKRRKKFTF